MATPPGTHVRGFLTDDEGELLSALACEAGRLGPVLEIGSWCGRSTIWLAQGAKLAGTVVLALDHHRGSEEHQPGEMFFDADLVDGEGRVDTLREFRRNIAAAGVEDIVIRMVAGTQQAQTIWPHTLGMAFIDGGHSLEAALTDWRSVGHRVLPGGILAIHDVFPDPADGGQAPYTIWQLATQSGLFEPLGTTDTLRGLRRLHP